MNTSAPEVRLGMGGTTAGTKPSFFFLAHVALLAIVLLGFSPTFYLREFFDVPPIPPILYVHGAVLTIWFSLVVLQGWLIHKQRILWHRRLGYVAAGYAAVVIAMGLTATGRMASRIESPAAAENIIVWGNTFTLILFATFVSLAVVFRKKPEVHRRLILLASISIIGPALARFPMWPMFAGSVDSGRNYAIGGLLLSFASLIVYDIFVRRRPHPASVAGAVAIVASIASAVYLGVSGTGFGIVQAMFAGR